MIRTLLYGRRGAAVLFIAAWAAALTVPAARAQAASITVSPNSGPPGSQFTITLNNFHACAADKPNCITIEFVQSGKATPLGTADSHGSPSFPGTLTVPPSATAGSAIVHARSDTDDTTTPFTVTNAPPATTTTTVAGTTTAPTTTTSTIAPTTTVATFVPPLTEPSTTTSTIVTKKSSSHSDVPRYIAVILVVFAAAATALVDTRMRRMNPPTGGP